MNRFLQYDIWMSGLQWLFFIFANIVVIPITVGTAFQLSDERVASMLHLSFIVTGIACVIQAIIGHRRPLLEGQSGLWWGVILTLASSAAAQGIPLHVVGGSLSIGIVISGCLTILIGLFGLGPILAKLFNSAVMGVFMFLFGIQLVGIFMKGMLGIPFGDVSLPGEIDVTIAPLSLVIVTIVILISVKGPKILRRYSLLIGMCVGWVLHATIFGAEKTSIETSLFDIAIFPLGKPQLEWGIIITVIMTGLLNIANTFGALKGTDPMYQRTTTKKEYRNHFAINGAFSTASGLLGLVPYAPYVSSIGFLKQTGDLRRLPFVLGGILFFMMGLIPAIGDFFTMLPLSVGSAVLFVAYLQLFGSSVAYFKNVEFTIVNVYRSAIPVFAGVIIMTMPAGYFSSLPAVIRPLISNGLLVGIVLSLLLENLVDWDRAGIIKKESSRNN
ncbi:MULTISPECIES: uracil/xanthine transporter [unclassified Virgibacillus]|uniref:uracil/xanthine transporter n=1 Tax=unclassified Virgibacillus TaxID=2620237 RepID=UPI0024DE2F06|nr:uracil/xanthine transporter [Virgibacillus sp. LDC-1]